MEDGYDAVQLAFDAVAERKLSKPELGHLKKSGVDPHRHLVELRGESGLSVGETVTVESFEPGEEIKVAGVSVGKGFAGHDQAARIHERPGVARLAQRPQAGVDRRVRDPSRVFKGLKMPGRMGGTRVTQLGLVVHEVDVERNLLLVRGAVPGRRTGSSRSRSV